MVRVCALKSTLPHFSAQSSPRRAPVAATWKKRPNSGSNSSAAARSGDLLSVRWREVGLHHSWRCRVGRRIRVGPTPQNCLAKGSSNDCVDLAHRRRRESNTFLEAAVGLVEVNGLDALDRKIADGWEYPLVKEPPVTAQRQRAEVVFRHFQPLIGELAKGRAGSGEVASISLDGHLIEHFLASRLLPRIVRLIWRRFPVTGSRPASTRATQTP